jgi:uncharacterized protein
MERMKRSLAALIFLVAGYYEIKAQSEEPEPAIKALAFAYSDSIAIRWAPTTPVAWQLLNKYGYVVERVTLTRNNKIIQDPERIQLHSEPLKPWKQEGWEKLIDVNDYAAIAAQAIYGSSFEATTGRSNDVMQIINLSKELEQRYSFALMAADLSRITATASALGIVDKKVRKNEKYLYKIYSAVPTNHMQIDTGYVFVGLEDKRDLPKPVKLVAKAGDKAVMLSWPRKYYEDIYVAYTVERSQDGAQFTPLTKVPIINTEPAGKEPSDLMYKLDSLSENNVTYFYRIRGFTPFGDLGPPSAVVSTMGVKTFDGTPAITQTKVENNSKVLLTWSFPEGLRAELKNFNVLRSTEADNHFVVINKEPVGASVFNYVDEQPQATNYYRIQALGKHGQTSVSFANLVQLSDSIPPSTPEGLKASVSNDGIITLSWNENHEEDLFGYRVFRSNYKSEEYSQITTSPVNKNLFIDTIAIKTLSDKVYYKITAVDLRFNTSPYGEILEVNRPDVVPPIPALFKEYSITDQGVQLKWAASPSTDITKYEIWRVDKAQKMTTFLKEYQPGDTSRTFLDVTADPGVLYEYNIQTFDDAGFKVNNPQTFQVRVPLPSFVEAPTNVAATVDRVNKSIELTWQFDLQNIEKYLIYRAKGEEPITLYKKHNDAGLFKDNVLEMNTTYRYRVQAVLRNGVQSKLSDEIKVSF